jgi:hypothetical protein
MDMDQSCDSVNMIMNLEARLKGMSSPIEGLSFTEGLSCKGLVSVTL